MEKMGDKLENINPKLYKKIDERQITAEDEDEGIVDEFDAREIFGMYNQYNNIFNFLINFLFTDMIRNINDPEHPLTLEELNVVEQNLIEVILLS